MDEKLKAQAAKLDAIMDRIGALEPEEWAQMAMLCINEAGASMKLQNEIAVKLVIFLTKDK